MRSSTPRAEFCQGRTNNTLCDYPLFWAPSLRASIPHDADAQGARRRLPGVRGREQLVTIGCPVCGELNAVTGVNCTRCTALLHPAPLPPPQAPERQEAPVVVEERVVLPARRPWWWPWGIVAGALLVELGLLVLWRV